MGRWLATDAYYIDRACDGTGSLLENSGWRNVVMSDANLASYVGNADAFPTITEVGLL